MTGIYPIATPKWGIEMVEGTINSWLKQPGDVVSKGDEILEIESDKIVNVWEAPADGILRRQLVAEGEVRAVGELLGIIAASDVEDSAIDTFVASYGQQSDSAEQVESATPAAVASPAPAPGNADVSARTNPVVKRLAADLGVDLASISGTGRNGRITQDDVRAAAATPLANTDSAPADFTERAFSATRKTIARRLTEAKQEIPHYYLSVDLELDSLLAHRERLNEASEQRVSLNDLMVVCTARALMAEPRVNINVVDDVVREFQHANIAVAIATDNGLFPVTVRHAETLSVTQISTQLRELTQRAESGALRREDMADASFTISNLGMLGIDQFTAIINPPMGALLALGRALQKPVVRDGELTVATLMTATLSCDHRAIDGAIGASFLSALEKEVNAVAQ